MVSNVNIHKYFGINESIHIHRWLRFERVFLLQLRRLVKFILTFHNLAGHEFRIDSTFLSNNENNFALQRKPQKCRLAFLVQFRGLQPLLKIEWKRVTYLNCIFII